MNNTLMSMSGIEATQETPRAINEKKQEIALSVIIVSYNTRAMTLDCLRCLGTGLKDISAEIFVVDNASADGSAEAVRAAFPHVTVIENDRNIGFGAANNVALRRARGEFLLLLNSDAFPKPGAVAALVGCLQRHPQAAAAGPRLLNADGSLQLSCFRFPSPAGIWWENLWVSALFPNHPELGYYRKWAHDQERAVDFVIGACMLVRREAYEQVGGFDDRFFMYAEETDWQRRMHTNGWQIRFTPEAVVTHLAGASGDNERVRVNHNFFNSGDLYIHKHYGLRGLVSVRLAMLIGCFLRMLLWAGVALLRPARRAKAAAKVRLMAWLCIRQATCWRLRDGASA